MGQRISLTIVTFLNKFDCHKRKKVCDEHIRHTLFCGKGGIRTPGASQHGGFQDRCNRPLYHLSKSLLEESFRSKAMQRYVKFLNSANYLAFFCAKNTKNVFLHTEKSNGGRQKLNPHLKNKQL